MRINLGLKLTFLFLILSIIPVSIISYQAYELGKLSSEDKVIAHLTSIAEIKKTELNNWFATQIKDVNMLTHDIGPLDSQKLSFIKDHKDYHRIFVADSSGKIVTSNKSTDVGKILEWKDLLKAATTKEIYIKDIFQSDNGRTLMVFAAPIFSLDLFTHRQSMNVIGILVAEIDMEDTLFPSIREWPGMGATGEVFLVRKEADNAVFLSNLRKMETAAFNLRIPFDSKNARAAIFAASGDEGILRGQNYRSVEALSAYRSVPLTGWGLVAQMDTDEAFASIVELRNKILVASLLLMSISIVVFLLASRIITRPVLMLRKLTEEVGKDRLDAEIEVLSNDELGDLEISFNQMINSLQKTREALKRSNQELEQFAYVTSHDLQEPLRAVSGFLQLLQKEYGENLDKKAEHYIQRSCAAAVRMRELIQSLLSYSRLHHRAKPMAPVDCEAVLDQVIANLEISIRESDAHVFRDPLPTVIGDPSQIGQVFQNLIGNSIKFRGDRTLEIRLGARNQNGEWVLSVRDNGIGIESEYNEQIYRIFQRLHSRSKYPGTGMGLAICKNMVERHGGRIWFESDPGNGSTFFFTLPDAGTSPAVENLQGHGE